MKRPVHIVGASAIGPQPVFDTDRSMEVVGYDVHPIKAILPDLKRYIDPVRGRRMEKVARIGIGTALTGGGK